MSVEFLRATPLFQGLSDEELREVVVIFREENQRAGAAIFRSDETCNELYLIRNGFVRLLDPDGSVLATLGPGSLLGEAEFLRGLAHNTSAKAATDVQMWALPDANLRNLLQRHFNIGVKLSQNFGEQIAQLEDYLVAQLAKTRALGELPHKVLWPVARSMQPHQLARGSFLYQAGDQAEALFLLERGSLELRPTPTPENSSPNANVVESGSLFGVLPLLTNKPYDSSAYAVEDCLIWTLPAATFYSLSSQFPLLRRTLGRHSRSRLSVADQTQAVVRLAQTPLFAELEPANLHAIVQRLVLQHVPAGEPIYRLGDASDALFLVDQGEVELTAENESGVLQELARIKVGSFFGAMSLLTGEDRLENATAIRNTNLWVLYRADLQELVGLHPAIGSALDQAVSARISARQDSMDEGRLRRFPLLTDLASRELREVARHLRQAQIRAGEQIYQAGAPSDALYLIERGIVRLQPVNAAGSWTRGEGEIFGEKAILSDEPYGQSAFAETDLDLLYIEQPGLDALKSRLPSLAVNLSRILSYPVAEGEEFGGVPQQRAGDSAAEYSDPDFGRQASVHSDESTRPRPRHDGGHWFGNLSAWAKVRLVLVVVLLLYLVVIVVPSLLGLSF